LTRWLLALVLVLPLAGCFLKTPRVERGTGVRFEYTILDEQGANLGGGVRLGEMVYGSGQLLPALEKAFEGRKEKEEFSVTIAPKDGFGEHLQENVKELPLERLPKTPPPEPGMKVEGSLPDGRKFEALIIAVGNKTATLDFNHPFAGKTVVYRITISHFFKPDEKKGAGK